MMMHWILYVADQQRSRDFYSQVLQQEPRLDVPGMTEFQIGPETVLGLMPETGVQRLLGLQPVSGSRCELYWWVPDLEPVLERALAGGGTLLSPPMLRDWGARVAYLLDPDQHVLALADNL